MIRYAKYVVPYLLKAPRRNPAKQLAGVALAYVLMMVSVLFLLIAGFIWLSKAFGIEIAFAATGLLLMCGAMILLIWLHRPSKAAATMPPKLINDPLAKYVPDTIRENPTTQKLLHQIGESPITATATAVTVGVLLSRELLEDI